jgi:hypothetical protein
VTPFQAGARLGLYQGGAVGGAAGVIAMLTRGLPLHALLYLALALVSLAGWRRDYGWRWSAYSTCRHEWSERGSFGDWWWECWLCGAQTDDAP